MRLRPLASAAIGLLAVASVTVVASAPAAHAASAPACSNSVNNSVGLPYKAKLRNVTVKRGATVVTSWAHTYPGRTVITRSQKIHTNWQVNVRAGLGASFSEQVGGGISLGKVVSASDSTKFGFNVRVQAGWNTQKSTTVMSGTKMTIPAAHSVAWYGGFQTVHGTFQYSYCKPNFPLGSGFSGIYQGTVQWRTSKWASFATGTRDSGGQRCDKPAETPVALKAKNALCLKNPR